MTYKKRKGMKVRIIQDGEFFTGIYLGIQRIWISPIGAWLSSPSFKVGRRIVYGYQCYWLPLAEAEKAEAMVAKERVKGGK